MIILRLVIDYPMVALSYCSSNRINDDYVKSRSIFNDFVLRTWLDESDRIYQSFSEYKQRMAIFKENYIQIQKMNEIYGYSEIFELLTINEYLH